MRLRSKIYARRSGRLSSTAREKPLCHIPAKISALLSTNNLNTSGSTLYLPKRCPPPSSSLFKHSGLEELSTSRRAAATLVQIVVVDCLEGMELAKYSATACRCASL